MTQVITRGGIIAPIAGVSELDVSPPSNIPPSPPTEVAATNVTTVAASISWLPSADLDGSVVGYRVYLDGVLNGSPTASPYALSGLTQNTSYTVAVRGIDDDGDLSAAETVSFKTLSDDTDPPTIPANFDITSIGSNGFTCTWGASTDTGSGLKHYELYETTFLGEANSQTIAAGTLTYTYTGLNAATPYNMRIRAVDNAGNKSAPAAKNVTTLAASDTVAPQWPTGAALTTTGVASNQVTLNWPVATDNVAVTEYRVLQVINNVDTLIASPAFGTNTYTVQGLTAATAYTFKLRARDAALNSTGFITTTVTTLASNDTTAPSKPTNLTYDQITSSGARLNWTTSVDEVGGSGLYGHVIYSYDATTDVETEIATVTGATVQYSVTELSPETSYKYRVKGKDNAGNLSLPLGGTLTTSAISTGGGGPLAGSMGFIPGDAGDADMVDLIIAHLNTRRNYLRGTTGQTHKMKTIRLSLQWQSWEPNVAGTRNTPGKKGMIDSLIADGLSPFLGAWFVPKWAQRRDILGMNMTGQAVTSAVNASGQTTAGTFIKFNNGVPKGNYGGITFSGAGVPAGSNPGGSDWWQASGSIIKGSGNVAYLAVEKRTAAAGTFVAQGSTSTYQCGGTNNDVDQKLLVDPSHYDDMYRSFKWLASFWSGVTSYIGFELSNEGNHVPYSRPRAYPEMFARQCMYAYAGVIAGSGSNYAERGVMPCSCAYRDDLDNSTFTYGDWTSGPNYLSPVTYYSRFLDEQKRLAAGTATGYSGSWDDLRKALPDGADISSKTNANIIFKDYATHAYTQYRRNLGSAVAGADNAIYPGAADAQNFNNTAIELHNLGWNKYTGTPQTILGNMLVHYTENGPAMGEDTNSGNATDTFGGLKATIGLGFTGTNTEILASTDTKKKNVMHPHETFVYMYKVYRYMKGLDPWPSSAPAWACGSNRMGTYMLFRGFGTIADDPPHQITACYVIPSATAPSGWKIRWVGPTATPVPARDGVTNNYFPATKGFSSFDAIAQAD